MSVSLVCIQRERSSFDKRSSERHQSINRATHATSLCGCGSRCVWWLRGIKNVLTFCFSSEKSSRFFRWKWFQIPDLLEGKQANNVKKNHWPWRPNGRTALAGRSLGPRTCSSWSFTSTELLRKARNVNLRQKWGKINWVVFCRLFSAACFGFLRVDEHLDLARGAHQEAARS